MDHDTMRGALERCAKIKESQFRRYGPGAIVGTSMSLIKGGQTWAALPLTGEITEDRHPIMAAIAACDPDYVVHSAEAYVVLGEGPPPDDLDVSDLPARFAAGDRTVHEALQMVAFFRDGRLLMGTMTFVIDPGRRLKWSAPLILDSALDESVAGGQLFDVVQLAWQTARTALSLDLELAPNGQALREFLADVGVSAVPPPELPHPN